MDNTFNENDKQTHDIQTRNSVNVIDFPTVDDLIRMYEHIDNYPPWTTSNSSDQQSSLSRHEDRDRHQHQNHGHDQFNDDSNCKTMGHETTHAEAIGLNAIKTQHADMDMNMDLDVHSNCIRVTFADDNAPSKEFKNHCYREVKDAFDTDCNAYTALKDCEVEHKMFIGDASRYGDDDMPDMLANTTSDMNCIPHAYTATGQVAVSDETLSSNSNSGDCLSVPNATDFVNTVLKHQPESAHALIPTDDREQFQFASRFQDCNLDKTLVQNVMSSLSGTRPLLAEELH